MRVPAESRQPIAQIVGAAGGLRVNHSRAAEAVSKAALRQSRRVSDAAITWSNLVIV